MRRLLAVCFVLLAARADETPVSPALLEPLDTYLQRAHDPAFALVPYVGAAVREQGDFEPLTRHVEALAKSEKDDRRRLQALWLAGRLRRILGDAKLAEAHFGAIAKADPESHDAWWAYASTLDARGREKEAVEAYGKALAAAATPQQRASTQLRLAMLRTKRGAKTPAAPAAKKPEPKAAKEETLVEYAKRPEVGADMRRRAATVLALLGRPQDAAALFVVEGEGTKRFRALIRLAQWQLEAKRHADAQTSAWKAVETAQLKRDRRYALSIAVEAHRGDKSLPKLLEKFAAAKTLSAEAREVWIDLLRELGRVDEAMRLFRNAAGGAFTVDMRRELLEMCREAGRDDQLEAAYRDVMKAQPSRLEWPEGLTRHFLERGRNPEAVALWKDRYERNVDADDWLGAASVLMDLGLDDWAIQFAEKARAQTDTEYQALLFLADLHRNRGRMEEASSTLDVLEKRAPQNHKARLWLADAYERLGRKKRATDVLFQLRKARGEKKSEEDLDIRLAVMLGEVDRDDDALALWTEVWRKVKSIPRRMYVEDRLLTVAARVGKLADIAIDLEQKMAAGTADQREAGLLVRLYTKASDSVSAAEVLEEHVKRSGGTEKEVWKQKSRVYLSCGDYHNYEKSVRKLMRLDPDGAPDYLRQLAMSALERGKPGDARKTLRRLTKLERSADGAAFEAGVLGLAGLQDEALQAYRRVLVQYPNQIEIYLLLAEVMKTQGRTERAIGMFQHLAETAEKDDLFTIAIDGLLNMEAPKPVLEWARRIVLERLARRHDKMYLYQLLSDLSEQVNDHDGMIVALENSLPIAGPRRSSL